LNAELLQLDVALGNGIRVRMIVRNGDDYS